MAEFLEDTGLPDLEGLGYEMRTRSERAMRTIIAGLPDGTWRGEVEVDGDEEPVTIRVRVEVAGDTVSVDLAGTSPQSARGINATFNRTYADVVYALLCALKPDSPINAGSLAPVRVSAPPGCILNAEYPAAVGTRVLVAHYVQAAVFRALEPILPHRVIADSAAPTWAPVLSGRWSATSTTGSSRRSRPARSTAASRGKTRAVEPSIEPREQRPCRKRRS